MSRAVDEWIGKTDDSVAPPRVQLRVYMKFNGVCQCGCGQSIRAGQKWQTDHVIAIINGGENREENLQPLLIEHHKAKTRQDVAIKSKTARVRAKHLGIKRKRSSFGTNRDGIWKKKMSGEVVRRFD